MAGQCYKMYFLLFVRPFSLLSRNKSDKLASFVFVFGTDAPDSSATMATVPDGASDGEADGEEDDESDDEEDEEFYDTGFFFL